MILVNGAAGDSIDALDRGLAYGDGVFRTLRAESGTPLFWSLHYRKLRDDCARLGIPCPGERTLAAEVQTLLRAQPDCVVKIIVTRGQGGRGYAPAVRAQSTRVVATFPLPPRPVDCDERGVRVRWCAMRLSEQPALAGVKHLNRLENVLARGEWSDTAIAEGLMCDAAGNVVEGTMSNVFILEGDRLVTPALDRCGVEGVQRMRLMDAAQRVCAGCDIDTISRPRLEDADQVYLVNSVIGAWWISALDARRWTRCETTPRLLAALKGES